MPRPLFHGWRLPVQCRVRWVGEKPAQDQSLRGSAGLPGRAGDRPEIAVTPGSATLLPIVFQIASPSLPVGPGGDLQQILEHACRTARQRIKRGEAGASP